MKYVHFLLKETTMEARTSRKMASNVGRLRITKDEYK
jgi:hypothetical protein